MMSTYPDGLPSPTSQMVLTGNRGHHPSPGSQARSSPRCSHTFPPPAELWERMAVKTMPSILPGSSQGCQDTCQPRHRLEDRQAPHSQSWSNAACVQHPICNTWSAVTETHRHFPPHARVFLMQRIRCFPLIPKQSSSSQRCMPAGSSAGR